MACLLLSYQPMSLGLLNWLEIAGIAVDTIVLSYAKQIRSVIVNQDTIDIVQRSY